MTNKNSLMSVQPPLLMGMMVLAVVDLAGGTRSQTDTNFDNQVVALPDKRAGRWTKAYVEAYNTRKRLSTAVR